MGSPSQVAALVQSLRKATSRIEQLKILGRAWKTIREMDSGERIEVAKELGMQEGSALLERLGQPGGVSPAKLAQAVVKAEQANPGELNQILQDIRTPSRRSQAIRKGARLMETLLPEQRAAIPLEPPAAQTKGPQAVPPPPPPPPAAPKPAPEAAQHPAEPPKETSIPLRALPSEREPPVQAQETTPASEPLKPPTAPRKAYLTTPSWARPFSRAEKPASPAPSPEPRQAGDLSLIQRFRSLDHSLRSGQLKQQSLQSILAGFPSGWARRRALIRLIQGEDDRDFLETLEAISALERARDQHWCFSALVRSRDLQKEEIRLALESAQGAASQRLLRRQLERLEVDWPPTLT